MTFSSSLRLGRITIAILLTSIYCGLTSASSSLAQIALDMVHETVDLEIADELVAGKQYVAEWQAAAPTFEYDGIVIQGFSDLRNLVGSVRFAQDNSWTPWFPLYIVRSGTDDAFLAGYFGTDRYRDAAVEVHFEGEGSDKPLVLAAGVFDTRLDEPPSSGDSGESRSRQGGKRFAVPTVIPPPLVTRAEWNASSYIGSPSRLSSSRYTNMTFHHAAGFTATTLEEGKAQVKAIQDFHQNGRGWSDIGYQFVVDRGGHVFQGRPFLDSSTTLEDIPELALGAHVGGFNTGNIGICMLGCYHPPEGGNCRDQITSVALDAYITMFAFLGEAYEIPIDGETLKGHRDFSATSCPGDNNYALLPSIRIEAVDLQQFGSQRPDGFFVEQNAPNPFTGATTVRYYMQQDGQVDVTVYDLAGREVAKLVNEFQDGPRWYRTTFDASGLPSGLYFYQVRVDGFSGEIFRGHQTLVHVR